MASSSNSSRPSKLQRLNAFRRSVPFVSQSALAAVLEEVDKHGLPELHSRNHMKQATTLELAKLDAYGPLFEEIN